MRKTKVIATLGPSSYKLIEQLVAAGVDVFRLNLSHFKRDSELPFLAKMIGKIRQYAKALGRKVEIMVDCPGHKFRLGQFEKRLLSEGDILHLSLNELSVNGDIPFPHAEYWSMIEPGQEILIGDGVPRFDVESRKGDVLECRVTMRGLLEPFKGLTARGLRVNDLNLPPYTEQDERALVFAVSQEVEQVVMSYGTTAAQTQKFSMLYREGLKGKGEVIFKYELKEASDDLSGIIEVSNGGFVGQGDLGLSVTHAKVATLAYDVVRGYRKAGKTCIVGTQMLSTMKTSQFPQHGESHGISPLIFVGATGIMVSDETSMGSHPVRVVEVLAATIEEVEAWIELNSEAFVFCR